MYCQTEYKDTTQIYIVFLISLKHEIDVISHLQYTDKIVNDFDYDANTEYL